MDCKKEKVFENTYVTVNVKSKKILSIKVTADEHVHDSKALPELVEDIIKLDSMTSSGKLLLGDGTYEGNEIFRCLLADNGILTCIKVRMLKFV